MSIQQINLYLPEFRPQKTYFSASFTVWSSAFLVLALIFVSTSSKNSADDFSSSVRSMEDQVVLSNGRLQKIKSISPKAGIAQLDQKIADLNASLKDRQRVGQVLEQQTLGNAEGFSDIMLSLARRSFAEFSLTRIRISSGGKFLELAGETRKIEMIPLYLQRLHAEESFANVRFGSLSMDEGEAANNIHSFSIGFESVYDLVEK